MKYIEVNFSAHPCNETITDVLAALTAEIGFESFVPCEGGTQAYIQKALFDEEALKNVLADLCLPTFLSPIPISHIPLPNPKTKTGTRSGKRISSNPL